MLRIIFTMFMILHGSLHFIGFAREWNVTSHQLSRRILSLTRNPSRLAGILWLLAGALFIIAGLLYLIRREWFWIPAAAALLVSQVMIIIYWDEARHGTWINILLLIIVIVSAAAAQFQRSTREEMKELLSTADNNTITITEEELKNLPSCVQKWIRQSGSVGKTFPSRVRIRQKGSLRTSPKGMWMDFSATQYVSLNSPGFVWNANINIYGIFRIAGRDKFMRGHGHMLIKPLYLFSAVNSAGPEIDQGSMLRFLGELSWFPYAAARDYLSWEEVDANSARVTMTYGDQQVSGQFFFDDSGRFVRFEALRYGDFDGEFRQETWAVTTTRYRAFRGVTIGSGNEVTWKLSEGDFKWLRLNITSLDPLP
jgi:hypothetical protein